MQTNRGSVVSLQICPAHRAPMQRVDTIEAIADLGLAGDAHNKQGSSRQVLLMDEETLIELGLGAGMVKENITTRGLPINALPVGTRLRVGAALLEVTIACTPCGRMDEIRAGLREVLKGQRGMLARVVEGGTLKLGDAIELMSA